MYIVIGGIPFRGYTGTGTFLGVKTIGTDTNLKVAELMAYDNYDDCGGLIFIVDGETGEIVSNRVEEDD